MRTNRRGLRWFLLAAAGIVVAISAFAVVHAAPPPGATQTTVNNGPGYQWYPRISGPIVTYTDNTSGIPRVRYKNVVTGVDALVPNNGESDRFSDVSGSAIVFARETTTRLAIYLFDTATGLAPVELAPSTAHRLHPAIGGQTVAWQDLGSNEPSEDLGFSTPSEIVVYDRSTATTTQLTNDALINRFPAVSPDGSVVVWEKCALVRSCDIWQARKSGGTWTAKALTAAGGDQSVADTNGQLVVYASTRTIGGAPETDIYWQPVGGGTEQRLALPDDQFDPRISGNLIVFEQIDATSNWEVRVFDLSTNILHDIASSPDDETMSDVSVSGNLARVAVARENGSGADVYVVSFPVAGTLVVNSTGDSSDADTADGLCATAAGVCTLRAAIEQSNAFSGKDTIGFGIPGAGPHTISPTSALPTITDMVVIDATTQPGFTGKPVVELEGSKAPSPGGGVSIVGLLLSGGNSTVRGLAINRFAGPGLWIASDGNAVEGNHIGTDVTGMLDHGNESDGVIVFGGSGNRIGGSTPAECNVISGNDGDGISLAVSATNNLIQGNYIGVDAAGAAALGNKFDGILIGGSGSAVTGTAIGANVVSGNGRSGVHIEDAGSKNTVIQGNHIGTNAAATAVLGNGQMGISVGTGPSGLTIKGNVISGNTLDGVNLSGHGSGVLIQGNAVGTDAAGSAGLGNGSVGVRLVAGAGGALVGGTTAGAPNTIAYNGSRGLIVLDESADTLQRNLIFANGSLGIDLGADGLTPNDPSDPDTGSNQLQNFPVLTAAVSGPGGTAVQGKLNSAANTAFSIELFSSAACDPSGHGEGEKYVGSTTVTTNASGDATFTTTLTSAAAAGQFLTATATGASGTSEFAACRQVKDVSGLTNDLIGTVQGLPGLQGLQKNGLIAKLQAALGSAKPASCNQLDAFINQVQGLLGNGLSQDEVDELVAAANLIKQSLGCP